MSVVNLNLLKFTNFSIQVFTLDVPLPKPLQVCTQHTLALSHLLPRQLILHLQELKHTKVTVELLLRLINFTCCHDEQV